MKKVWMAVGLTAAVWVAGTGTASAISRFDNVDSQYPFETTVVTSSTASVGTFNPGAVIYGFRLIADDAGDACGLYDVATLGAAAVTQGIFIDELVEDTDNRSQDSDWPRPYVLTTDLTVVTNGICVIYHDPK